MNKRAKHLMAVCAVPVLILLGMCVVPLYTLYHGQEIILPTKPVDPSDIFRGDYIALSYEAEEVPVRLLEKDVVKKAKDGGNGFIVYVALVNKNGVYAPINVSFHKPQKGVYLKGTLNYLESLPNMTENQDKKILTETAYIEYSLDKYFIEDNTGTKWEQASAKGDLLAKVKVFNGYAILTGIKEK